MSNVLEMGNKLDLILMNADNENRLEQGIFSGSETRYVSVIYDINDSESIVATIPQDKGKLILMPVGMTVFMISYGKTGLYKCKARVKERFKTGNTFLMTLEIVSLINKFQRRDYFRWDCLIDMDFRILPEDVLIKPIEAQTLDYYISKSGGEDNIYSATILDISGGGAKFTTRTSAAEGSIILMTFVLENEYVFIQPIILAKLLASTYREDSKLFENRVQFNEITKYERESIVKYIFEEERKARKISKG